MNPLFEPNVVLDVDQIAPLLVRQFGASVDEMTTVAKAIYRSFVGVSTLHPKGFNGTSGWAEGSAQVRAIMIPKGWHPEDPQNQPRVTSRKRKLAITVSSGNAYTGVPDRTPQTRNDKGAQTASSIKFNSRQTELFPRPADGSDSVVPLVHENALWIFLYYIDFDNRELRFELSQPTAMSDQDKVNQWAIRYIFPPLRFDAEIVETPQSDIPDIDIEVTPKLQ